MNIATRKAARSSGVLLAENLLRLGSTALISLWTARVLGPGDFGLLMFASAVTAILFAVSTLGLELPSVVRLARGEPEGQVLGTALALRLGAALLAWGLALIAATTVRPDQPQAQALTLIVALSLIGYAPTVLDYAFKARVLAGPPAAARLVTTLLSSLAKAAVLLSGGDVTAMAWTVTFESLLAAGFMAFAWHRHAGPGWWRTWSVQPALAARLFQQGWPLLAAGLGTALHMKADVVLMGRWVDTTTTGQYALAQKLSELLYVVPLVVVDSLYPLLARRHGAEVPGAATVVAQQLFDWAWVIGLVTVLGCWLLGPTLLSLTFGPAYAASASLWQWHALSGPAVAMDAARQRWLVAQQMGHKAWRFAWTGALLSLGLNLLLIPQLGATGAAVAAAASWWLCAVAATWLDPTLRPLARMQWRALWPWARLWRGEAR